MSDNVNHPSHYTSHPSGVECIQVTEHMTFNCGNAVKYIWRNGLKDTETSGKQLEDLKKAIWYLQREVQRLELETPIKKAYNSTIDWAETWASMERFGWSKGADGKLIPPKGLMGEAQVPFIYLGGNQVPEKTPPKRKETPDVSPHGTSAFLVNDLSVKPSDFYFGGLNSGGVHTGITNQRWDFKVSGCRDLPQSKS